MPNEHTVSFGPELSLFKSGIGGMKVVVAAGAAQVLKEYKN